MTALYLVIYAALLVSLVGCVVRAVSYARLPLHLRWELYPVPHEERERAKHGGSYFEVADWWTKTAPFNLSGELKSMSSEILFLRGLWEFKRKMWYRSYPFHLGLYLLIGAGGLLLSSALFSLAAPQLLTGETGTILHLAYTAAGLAGAALTIVGAIGLLVQRLTDDDLKTYTVPGDIFNLLFFVVTLGILIAGYLLRPGNSPGPLALVRGLLTFDTTLNPSGLLTVGLVLAAGLAAYIPMTHMSHFIAKYFTYHSVRWDDKPSASDSRVREKVAAYLIYRPTWSAGHVGADGVRTWKEIITINPAQGGRK